MHKWDEKISAALNMFYSPRVVYLSELLTKCIDHLLVKKCQVTLSQFKVMFLLNAKGSLPQSDITGSLGLTPAAISRQVNFLVEKGSVVRSTNPTNRRQNQLQLTKVGQEQVKQGMNALLHFEKTVFSQVPDSDLKHFNRTADYLIDILGGCRAHQSSSK